MTNVKDKHEDRRAGFVDSLLNADKAEHTVVADVMDSTHQEKIQMPHIVEYTGGTDHNSQSVSNLFHFSLDMFRFMLPCMIYVCGICQMEGR